MASAPFTRSLTVWLTLLVVVGVSLVSAQKDQGFNDGNKGDQIAHSNQRKGSELSGTGGAADAGVPSSPDRIPNLGDSIANNSPFGGQPPLAGGGLTAVQVDNAPPNAGSSPSAFPAPSGGLAVAHAEGASAPNPQQEPPPPQQPHFTSGSSSDSNVNPSRPGVVNAVPPFLAQPEATSGAGSANVTTTTEIPQDAASSELIRAVNEEYSIAVKNLTEEGILTETDYESKPVSDLFAILLELLINAHPGADETQHMQLVHQAGLEFVEVFKATGIKDNATAIVAIVEKQLKTAAATQDGRQLEQENPSLVAITTTTFNPFGGAVQLTSSGVSLGSNATGGNNSSTTPLFGDSSPTTNAETTTMTTTAESSEQTSSGFGDGQVSTTVGTLPPIVIGGVDEENSTTSGSPFVLQTVQPLQAGENSTQPEISVGFSSGLAVLNVVTTPVSTSLDLESTETTAGIAGSNETSGGSTGSTSETGGAQHFSFPITDSTLRPPLRFFSTTPPPSGFVVESTTTATTSLSNFPPIVAINGNDTSSSSSSSSSTDGIDLPTPPDWEFTEEISASPELVSVGGVLVDVQTVIPPRAGSLPTTTVSAAGNETSTAPSVSEVETTALSGSTTTVDIFAVSLQTSTETSPTSSTSPTDGGESPIGLVTVPDQEASLGSNETTTMSSSPGPVNETVSGEELLPVTINPSEGSTAEPTGNSSSSGVSEWSSPEPVGTTGFPTGIDTTDLSVRLQNSTGESSPTAEPVSPSSGSDFSSSSPESPLPSAEPGTDGWNSSSLEPSAEPTTASISPKSGAIISWSFRIVDPQREWDSDLANKGSSQYIELHSALINDLEKLYNKLEPGRFIGVTIKQFKQGSIVVEGETELTERVESTQLLDRFAKLVGDQGNTVGGLLVDVSSITFDGRPKEFAPQSGSPTGGSSGAPGWVIAVIVAAVVVVFAVAAAAVIIKRRRSRRNNRDSYMVDEETMNGGAKAWPAGHRPAQQPNRNGTAAAAPAAPNGRDQYSGVNMYEMKEPGRNAHVNYGYQSDRTAANGHSANGRGVTEIQINTESSIDGEATSKH